MIYECLFYFIYLKPLIFWSSFLEAQAYHHHHVIPFFLLLVVLHLLFQGIKAGVCQRYNTLSHLRQSFFCFYRKGVIDERLIFQDICKNKEVFFFLFMPIFRESETAFFVFCLILLTAFKCQKLWLYLQVLDSKKKLAGVLFFLRKCSWFVT